MSSTWSYESTSDDENIANITCTVLESYPPQYRWNIIMKSKKVINLFRYKDNLDLFTEKDLLTINTALANAQK